MSDYEKEEGKEQKDGAASSSAPRKSAFLRGGDSDSSENSDDDDESDSDDDSDDDDETGEGPAVRKQSRFLRGASDDSDSEEEVKKVIKSARDKRVDEMDAIVKTIENAQRIDDWVAISKEFDALVRLSDRIKVVNEPTPPSFYKTLASIEDSLNASLAREKTAEKKMKAPNARALNGMRQKLKKVTKDHDESISVYRKDPEAFEASYVAATAPPPAAAQPKKVKKSAAIGEEDDDDEDEDFQTVGRGGKAVTYTSEGLFKSLATVMEARGRKSTDRTEQINILSKLLGVAASTYQKIRVLLALLAARFDYNQSAASYLNLEMWASARLEVEKLLKVLNEDRTYQVHEQTKDYDDEIDRRPNEEGEGAIVEVRGSIISFVERLDDEFTKSLQHIDPHTTEYVERLREEKLLYHTIVVAQSYFETVQQTDALGRIMMRRLEHIYAKPDNIIQAHESASLSGSESLQSAGFGKSSVCPSPEEVAASAEGASSLIRTLCVELYKTSGFETERLRTRAMLCHIYHHALRCDYHTAHDMFLMSHLQDTIGMADAATQILYNRVVVQLGICAFRVGLIHEAQGALQEIFASTRVKELLAQGVSRVNPYVSPEQEKLDRQRQLPFHMHINMELLECIYLIASMLLEIPNLARATSEADLRKNVISRTFRKMLDFTDRQIFSGPAESTRDHVMAAAKALQNGNWKESQGQISEIKIWKLMSDHEEILTMLKRKIQEEGLRTYLFTYSHFYKSLSLRHLADMFDLTLSQVKSLVSAMIWSEDIQASLDIEHGADGEHDYVIFHGVQLSKVQQLAQQLAEKANALLEQNERSLDAKLGERAGPGAGATGQEWEGRDGRDGRDGGGRREGRRGGGSVGRGRGRGRGRAQFNALPGQQTV